MGKIGLKAVILLCASDHLWGVLPRRMPSPQCLGFHQEVWGGYRRCVSDNSKVPWWLAWDPPCEPVAETLVGVGWCQASGSTSLWRTWRTWTGLTHWALLASKRGERWLFQPCLLCLYPQKIMADLCRIDKYLNMGPVSDFVLATKYILDSWSRKEKCE